MSRVRRIDLAGGDALAPPKQLPNGTWVLEGYATRSGVLRYLNPDGTERLEYRSPEEVEKAAANLALCVLTLRHPPEGYVTPATSEKHQRGTVLDAGWDATSQRVPVRCHVTHQALLDALAAGTHELSPGYEATVTEEAGVAPDGQRYTHVQSDIHHNHLAVVERGRAGPGCALRLDAAGNATGEVAPIPPIPIPSIDTPAATPSNGGNRNTAPSSEGKEQPMEVEVVIGGVTFKVPKALADAFEAEKKAWEEKVRAANASVTTREVELDAAKKDAAAKGGEVVVLQTKVDAAEKDAKEAKVRLASESAEVERLKKLHADAATPEVVEKRVAERVALIAQATPVLGKKYDFTKASPFQVRCDALEKLVAQKPALKSMVEGMKAAKDESGISVLFNAEMARFDAGETHLGGEHADPPPSQDTSLDAMFIAHQKQLVENQRKRP